MKLYLRTHDVAALGMHESVRRWCDFCHEEHTFVVMAVVTGLKIGQAECPKAPTGRHAQPLAVDHWPYYGRKHDLSSLELGQLAERVCEQCRQIHGFIVVDTTPGQEIGSVDCRDQIWTQQLAVDYPPPPDDTQQPLLDAGTSLD